MQIEVWKEQLLIHQDVELWKGLQVIFMPGIDDHVASEAVASTGDAETGGVPQVELESILLPSTLLNKDDDVRLQPWFPTLANIELQLRCSQANRAMQSLTAVI